MILLRRWIDVRLLTLLTLVVSIAAVDSQVFAQAGWTPFGELPGADAYQAMSRNGRRVGGGGRVRDVRFDETAAYFMTGTGWQKVDFVTGERSEADPRCCRIECGPEPPGGEVVAGRLEVDNSPRNPRRMEVSPRFTGTTTSGFVLRAAMRCR